MVMSTSAWKQFAGQTDVQPILHVPMVYEHLPYSAPHWEYRVISVDTQEATLPDEALFNELGAQGWLLVGAQEQHRTQAGALVHYYFVRQKSEA
ncbi:MAG TPA: hypothetical protein VGF67_08435 [Ktedonobacteraceae bacterium]|jgi:hypothetical protein